MANASYSPASLDLGLGNEGDALNQQMTEEEKLKRKKLAQMGGYPETSAGGAMGLAAMNLLGSFRG